MAKDEIIIKEIFESVQGEGPYVGEKQLFVRTTRCNLKCAYCDTDFKSDDKPLVFSFDDFFKILKASNVLTISFTGGEPLLESEFLIEFLKKYKNRLNKKIYLETNGTRPNELLKIINHVDIISMDIKLKSAAGPTIPDFIVFEKFLEIAVQKETFVKVVFDEKITDIELNAITELVKKYNVLVVLQPKMPMAKGFDPQTVFEKFYKNYKNVRLIPQMHKFLNVR